jgi:GTP cyclohydrolase II
MRLMSNNPSKFTAMEAYGLEVVERVPLEAPQNGQLRALPVHEARQDGAHDPAAGRRAGAEGRR